jgi:putative 4-mercaptohistidine N1-methyltranferase
MPWDWPVEVNCLEAEAFCAWKSAQGGVALRLPSEDEWRRLRDLSGVPDVDGWQEAPANIGLAYGASPCPVQHFRHCDFYDVIGNVWQWTATPIYPFGGFAVHPYYDDFTTPTFDQQHNLIKGGSFIALGNEMHREARYAFRRHFFQHAGFRYVRSTNPLPEVPVYESDAAISQYCDFHYGPGHFGVGNFPAAVAELAVQAMAGRPLRRALDIGCAVGRSSFALARHCPEVTGLDFSARFIQVGVHLREQGSFSYTLVEEGELLSYHTARLADLDLAATAGRVQFFQADACNLKPLYRDYDLVVAANLIDRLYQPRKFLQEIPKRIVSGGILVLTSPYTWLAEHTPREEWLGGFKRNGENFTTLDALRELLAPHFRLLQEPLDQPFVIRETARKYQHSLAQVTLWERL